MTEKYKIELLLDAETCYEQLFEELESNTPIEREYIDDWERLFRTLSEDMTAGDLVVCASARRNTIGWRPELQELTERVSTLTPGDFVVIYPPVGRSTDEQPQLSME